MATKSGSNASVKIGSTTVANMASWTLTDTKDALKAPVFGETFNVVHGMGTRNVAGTIEGYLDVADTAGQETLKTAYTGGTGVSGFRLYLDDTIYYAPDTVSDVDAAVYLNSLEIGATQNEIIPVSFAFEVSRDWKRSDE